MAIADEPVPPETVLCVGVATGLQVVAEAPSWPGAVTSPESPDRPRGVEVP